MPILWVDKLSVSNDQVDSDHKTLISIINQIEKAIENKTDIPLLKKSLNELEDYTHEHFRREESLMKSISYPHFYRHFKEHRKLVNKLEKIKRNLFDKIDNNLEIDNPDSLIDLLRNWLLDHVMKEDLLLKPYFKKRLLS